MIQLLLAIACQQPTETPRENPQPLREPSDMEKRKGECESNHGACQCSSEGGDIVCNPEYTYSIGGIPPETRSAMTGVTWRQGCPLSLDDLSLVQLLHWTDKATVEQGRLVVATVEAENIAAIFGELYQARYPIVSIRLMHHFGGSDDASMKANNTSAFNCRNIKNTDTYSQHSFGQAIDVNPLWNPWVRGDIVDPPEGRPYLDREQKHPGLIRDGDTVVRSFAKYGWKWGGHWTTRKDYQHFSTSGK